MAEEHSHTQSALLAEHVLGGVAEGLVLGYRNLRDCAAAVAGTVVDAVRSELVHGQFLLAAVRAVQLVRKLVLAIPSRASVFTNERSTTSL